MDNNNSNQYDEIKKKLENKIDTDLDELNNDRKEVLQEDLEYNSLPFEFIEIPLLGNCELLLPDWNPRSIRMKHFIFKDSGKSIFDIKMEKYYKKFGCSETKKIDVPGINNDLLSPEHLFRAIEVGADEYMEENQTYFLDLEDHRKWFCDSDSILHVVTKLFNKKTLETRSIEIKIPLKNIYLIDDVFK
jgi:hypothetical protein